MAVVRKRTLVLSTGKVIRMTGTSIAVTPGLEVGEGFTSNIFGLSEIPAGDKNKNTVVNPYQLTREELIEMADFMIRCWMDLKDNVRDKGLADPEIFRRWLT